MSNYLERYKGIHPGIILEREFKKRALHKRPFALSIGEHPQTLNAITKGKRKLNIALALKIEEKLGFEEGSLAILQTYFDINEEKQKNETNKPNMKLLRNSLFWDTDISKIEWNKQFSAVIRRVFDRGNEIEKQELIRFYGSEKINIVLNQVAVLPYTIYNHKSHNALL
jgi:plasmid maintenance system antidote protein VapI